MDILTNPDINNFSGFYYEKVSSDSFYFHSALEVICCIDGEMTAEFNKGSINLKKDECLIVSPFIIHRIKDVHFKAEKVCFNPKALSAFYSEDAFEKYVNPLFKLPLCKIKNSKVCEIINSIRDSKSNANIDKFLCTAELLYLLKDEIEKDKGTLTLRDNKAFIKMVDFIEQNLSRHISTGDLSKKFNLTSSHIGYIFKNEIGLSPVTYITNQKLSKAAKMLMTSSKNVKSTASACGFNSALYFQKIFKDAFGVTPGHFQNSLK